MTPRGPALDAEMIGGVAMRPACSVPGCGHPADGCTAHDPINHPRHYTSHPSGVECITITEHLNFCLGNAVKYIWRAGEKGAAVEDLKKARWYIDREIRRLESKP
jgi:hypothetical protein